MDMQKRVKLSPRHEPSRPPQWWEQPRQWHQLALLTECINAELKSPIPLRDIDPVFRWVRSPDGEFYSMPYRVEFGGLPVEMAPAHDFAPDGQVVV